jgi:hypothetical protein
MGGATRAHINVTTFTRFAQNGGMGSLLALYDATMLLCGFSGQFFYLVHDSKFCFIGAIHSACSCENLVASQTLLLLLLLLFNYICFFAFDCVFLLMFCLFYCFLFVFYFSRRPHTLEFKLRHFEVCIGSHAFAMFAHNIFYGRAAYADDPSPNIVHIAISDACLHCVALLRI